MSDAPIPGWYPNPSNSVAEWRWWNGSAWTSDITPRQDAPVRRSLEWNNVNSAYRDDSLRSAPRVNTVWIWLLAFSSLIFGAVTTTAQAVFALVPSIDSATGALIGGVSGLVLLLVFAHLDGRDLRRRGFEAPSILWMLVLAPLVYFAVRARKLKHVGAASKGPERALLIVIGVQILFGVALAVLLVNGLLPDFPSALTAF